MKKLTTALCTLLFAGSLQAGGTPEFVALPDNYKKQANYMTQNRIGQEQVAKIYADKRLLEAIAEGKPVPERGTIVMEVYAPQRDANNNPVKGSGGNYLISHLEAIAVMENRDHWPEAMPEDERAGNWGFALYTPEGEAKTNDLDCAGCHWQLRRVNYLFTTVPMKNYIKSHP